jgi:hypothetical protein
MRRSVLFACALVTAACGGGGPTNPGGGGVTNFTAKIDGTAWAPEFSPIAVNAAAGLYSISAFKSTGADNYTIVLSLSNITGTGTYPIGVTPQVFGASALISQAPSSGWSSPLSGDAGEIVITTLTATRMVATFEFLATPLMGTAVNKTVTEGQFDIVVSGTGGLAAANQGSSLTGTIGGPFIGATGAVSLNSGTLTIVSTNPTRNITIGIANMTGAGSYTLGASPLRTIQVGDGVGAVWTSNTSGGSGSVTISSATTQRIVGTFTAAVVGVAGSASGTLNISGSFNMGCAIAC